MEANKSLFSDRKRTNILSSPEQKLIIYLVPRVPSWISSDGLTAIGTFGSVLILISFILAKYVAIPYLLLGILGFIINWVGDSMDGRIAYYRNKSRKWYGFSLDIIMDWVSTVMIGLGYVIYADGKWELTGFLLVACYGWSMIISQLRYKISDKYTIDAGLVGPTEIRVIICLVLLLEVLFPGTMDYLVIVITCILFFINIGDTKKLLDLGDERDRLEKENKSVNN
ncbi:CDP-alcohol phosphatidyltransferase family protein [Sphingobacterium hungaricum]|uniref:CDP-alcohol phosphatidyltransferase n=1 Tax=Sphingobacterium hungaricum TaxID=2082723 RepID=A0A928UY74_9SPHI|nr:CDP-alcohol phosphatidyltransferase family protein [Sphingobacterium hungaricum]MBE8713616.1 CDP-alcohol phosphatidyltransferase [Sphingobacterium hungaricum]